MKHGDFTGLAQDYSRYRPDYSRAILRGILGIVGKSVDNMDVVDVGAGTGIWTRMLAGAGVHSVTAVEPNDDMRSQGTMHPDNHGIVWKKGSGEETGLASACADLVSMASSFHWVDFDRGIAEFDRVLRPGGCFVALWNPRFIEVNPLLVEIEAHLATLKGSEIKRVSSGRSEFTNTLTERLEVCGRFTDVIYLESKHVIPIVPERYVGAWRSVNDLRVQLGPDGFMAFLAYVEDRIKGLEIIEATYLTRAWVAMKPV
ncbi:MAG: class I SAM-dependent methyltransferase [Gammaproteobacteria bacterium]|nr:class I SAM-dependent methyltransferase [Gammaproteobacteria bacterium]